MVEPRDRHGRITAALSKRISAMRKNIDAVNNIMYSGVYSNINSLCPSPVEKPEDSQSPELLAPSLRSAKTASSLLPQPSLQLTQNIVSNYYCKIMDATNLKINR